MNQPVENPAPAHFEQSLARYYQEDREILLEQVGVLMTSVLLLPCHLASPVLKQMVEIETTRSALIHRHIREGK